MASAARRRRPTTTAGKESLPDQPHGSPTAKPCPLHARLGEAHRLNKHTPAGWPTHHGASTPPAPTPASLGTILQRASGETNHLRQPAPWKHSEQKRGARYGTAYSSLWGQPPICQQSQSHFEQHPRPQRSRRAAQVLSLPPAPQPTKPATI